MMEKTGKFEVKTMLGWHISGAESWDEYAKPGDIVSEDCVDYFLQVLPPFSMDNGYVQVGEPYSHRLNPVTGKQQATYGTFTIIGKGVWKYRGNCFKGEIFDADAIGEVKTLQEYMKATYSTTYGIQDTRPRIICKDGFSMSVQAGESIYSKPRKNLESGEYTHIEIGYPSKEEELLRHYAEDPRELAKTVYPYVPIEVVEKVIEKHGGFMKCIV